MDWKFYGNSYDNVHVYIVAKTWLIS